MVRVRARGEGGKHLVRAGCRVRVRVKVRVRVRVRGSVGVRVRARVGVMVRARVRVAELAEGGVGEGVAVLARILADGVGEWRLVRVRVRVRVRTRAWAWVWVGLGLGEGLRVRRRRVAPSCCWSPEGRRGRRRTGGLVVSRAIVK